MSSFRGPNTTQYNYQNCQDIVDNVGPKLLI